MDTFYVKINIVIFGVAYEIYSLLWTPQTFILLLHDDNVFVVIFKLDTHPSRTCLVS